MQFSDASINAASNANSVAARSMQPITAADKVRSQNSKSKKVSRDPSAKSASETSPEDTLDVDLTTEVSADRDPQERNTYRKQDIEAKSDGRPEVPPADDNHLDLLG